ncbi:putative extracellular endoglucanase [Bisporella sp. PMI_857]|nr:putative extracellular endoglucanase [Bisporella sp. PMI_857]
MLTYILGYSQCIPGTGPSTTTSTSSRTSTATTLSTRTTSVTSSRTSTTATATGTQACTAAFTPVTASAAFAALNPGWNLGNTLDAVPDEGSWNNAPVQASTFTAIAARGFKSVRIPVTWAYHFSTQSPTWTVDPTWINRVETVVDQALAAGFYVVLNVHHDSWIWADVSASGANITAIEERFTRLWAQIGARFACKSSKLIFEAINEPVGTTQEHATELNKLNGIFLDQINKAGGYNPQRVVSLSGLGQDSIKTSQWFVRGSAYPNQPWGLQFHYYSPYDFIFSAWGKTIWGSDADKATLLQDFTLFNGNFSSIPTFVGEWDASTANTEPAARWKYFDYFIRTANRFKYSTILWDNGNDHYDRTTNIWRDPISISTLFSAVAGTTNSLADSTTDASATTQSSGATLFHKVGDAVAAQSVTYLLNGNSLTAIRNSAGTALTSSQYSISGGTVTFSAAYLSTLYTSTAAAGIKDTLTLTFSAGTPLTLQVVQYDTPTIPTTTYKLSTVGTSSDLTVPITYKGLPKVAAIKATKADGTYLSDDWTVWLGPLQQSRWTYGSWNWDATGLIVFASGLQTLQATGQTVTLLVEFFPRSVGSNAVNITFTQ